MIILYAARDYFEMSVCAEESPTDPQLHPSPTCSCSQTSTAAKFVPLKDLKWSDSLKKFSGWSPCWDNLIFLKCCRPLGCWPQMTCSLKSPKVNCISVCWLLLILQLSAWSSKMWTQPHIFWTSCSRNRELRRWGAGETIIFFQQFPEFPLWVARRPQHCS